MSPSSKARFSQRHATSAVGRKLTLEDVAKATGVSRSTVSNAFNRPDQLSAALREEVLAKARKLGVLRARHGGACAAQA